MELNLSCALPGPACRINYQDLTHTFYALTTRTTDNFVNQPSINAWLSIMETSLYNNCFRLDSLVSCCDISKKSLLLHTTFILYWKYIVAMSAYSQTDFHLWQFQARSGRICKEKLYYKKERQQVNSQNHKSQFNVVDGWWVVNHAPIDDWIVRHGQNTFTFGYCVPGKSSLADLEETYLNTL